MRNSHKFVEYQYNSLEPASRLEDPPEVKLWRAVLLQAVVDTADRNFRIRQEAQEFINNTAVFEVMDLARIDRKWIHKIRQFVADGKVVQFKQKKLWMELLKVPTPKTDKFLGGYHMGCL